jgi:ABC-type glycerol-3-phosphate transport system substrate-binding protein
MRRTILVILVIFATTAMLFAGGKGEAASSGGASQVTTVKVRSGWTAASIPHFAGAIERYETTHPGIKIDMEYTPAGEDSMSKLRAEFVAGNPPDVVQAWKYAFNEYVDEGLVENLNAEYDRFGWKSGVLAEGARSWCAPIPVAANPNADVYGVADYINTSVIFYNTDIFNQLNLREPTTLDELFAVSRAIRAAGKKPMVVVGGAGNFLDLFAKIQCQFTGLQYLIDVNLGKAKLTDSSMLRAMEIVDRLFKEGVVDRSCMTYDEMDCMRELARGNAAMYAMHTANDILLLNLQKEYPDFHYGIMRGVKFTDNPVTEYSCTYGGCWMVPKMSKVKPQAKEFLFYIFGEEVSKAAAAGGRITNMVRSNGNIASPAIQTVVQYQLPKLNYETFYLIDMIPGSVQMSLNSGLQEMLGGTGTPLRTLQNAQQVMDRILADR